jgi:beta-mannosidase
MIAGVLLTSCVGYNDHKACQVDSGARQLEEKIDLGGPWKMKLGFLAPSNGYLPDLDDSSWRDVAIPSNWYLSGLDYSGSVWLRKHFVVPKEISGKSAEIIFQGVDYAADVWLNGRYLGFNQGSFFPFSFNIADILKPGEGNVLAVRVDSPHEEAGRFWGLRKRLIKGIFNHHDTRPGGAWSLRGQERNTGGIWAPVCLKFSEAVLVKRIRVTPLIEQGKVVRARVEAVIWSPASLECRALLTVKPYNFAGLNRGGFLSQRSVSLTPGTNRLEFMVECPGARLWWTWDHGEQPLYEAHLSFMDQGRFLGSDKTVFGFRKIEWDPETMVFKLNGKRIFLRGTNYISTQWLAEMDRDKYLSDTLLMKRANINAVRVHAHVEAGEFYRVCDETGLLVWQDFPLQWGYSDEPVFAREAERQARIMVDTLYNHPSIFVWCGHNEPPWDASWMKYKYKDYAPEQNRLLDEGIYRVLRESDSSRYVHKVSATREHPWFGWYSLSWRDYGRPAKHPLVTEFGAQALPGLDSLRKIFTEEELWPQTDRQWEVWKYHNFQPRETFEIAKVKKGRNILEFIENTQAYQSRLIKYAAESYRRQRFSPVTAIFQFMFVEDWPSVNWGIVDYFRETKPGYEALRTAYQPVLPCIDWKKEQWGQDEAVTADIWVINDLFTAFKDARLSWTISHQGKVLDKGEMPLDIGQDQADKVLTLTREHLPVAKLTLSVLLEDVQGNILGQNTYLFEVRGE